MTIQTNRAGVPFTSPPTTRAGAYTYTVNSGQGFLDPSISLSSATVGGTVVPIDKLAVLAPYIGIASLILATAFGAILRIRRRRTSEGTHLQYSLNV